ncbi:MAG: hypothetical protein AMJ81_13395 [Phycisphaerae bacterium SM23_33]|nr:MAG: hypothetical protein AMJ81_13395 [Phycisphaerae bacterium SM23_33]
MKALAMTPNKRKATAAVTCAMFAAVILGTAGTAFAPPLGNGHARVVSGAAGSLQLFWIDLPDHCSRLTIQLTGGWGNANLSARRPGSGAWTLHSNHPGNHEHLLVNNPAQGRWFILVRGAAAYHNASLVATFQVRPGAGWERAAIRSAPAVLDRIMSHVGRGGDDGDSRPLPADDPEVRITTLQPGRRVSRLSGAGEVPHFYRITLTQELGALTFTTQGGRGNCELLVRRDDLPTPAEYDARGAVPGTSQAVVIRQPAAGVYYVRLVGQPEFRDVSLMADVTEAQIDDLRIVPLRNQVAESGLEGRADSRSYFMIHFAQAPSRMTITTRDGEGRCRMYLRRDGLPTTEQFDQQGSGSLLHGTHQTIRLERDLAAGTYYVMLQTPSGYRGVTLLVEADVPAAAEQISILTPTGQAALATGRAYQVTWQAPEGVEAVSLEVSWDAGQSWQQLACLPARTPGFTWYIPADQAVNGDGALLRISESGNPSNAAVRNLSF